MSVAFRRDGDEEHLEPKFELPIPPGPNLVTPRGRKLIDERVVALEARIAELAVDAELEAVRRDLRYWQTRQVTAELAPAPNGETVQIGTRVEILLNGKPRRLSIVGHDEAEPAQDRLAYAAPLSRALIGAEAGDVLAFGQRADAIEVLAIEVADD
ncbi:MAG: GreA/GreB family elongation factor [Novosphingobium sp.]|nr:GreA/GreB family elongation factor [Novosphingobium sp.]